MIDETVLSKVKLRNRMRDASPEPRCEVRRIIRPDRTQFDAQLAPERMVCQR